MKARGAAGANVKITTALYAGPEHHFVRTLAEEAAARAIKTTNLFLICNTPFMFFISAKNKAR
jgi:hypothetical protein